MKTILIRKSKYTRFILTETGMICIDMFISFETGKRTFERSFYEGCHWKSFHGTPLFKPWKGEIIRK